MADNNNSIAWIGIEKLADKKDWNVVDSEAEAGFINIKKNILDSLEDDNTADFCVTLKESGGWNTYRDCRSVTNRILACNACQFSRSPMFTLRGSCAGAGPNWNYYLVQDRTREIGYYLEGYKRDWVEEEAGKWKLHSSSGSHLFTLQPYVAGPAGRRLWFPQDEMKSGCESEANTSTLTLSTCIFREEFTCNNGHCIDKVRHLARNTAESRLADAVNVNSIQGSNVC